GEDLLAFFADLEVEPERGGVRMRRALGGRNAVWPRDRFADGKPLDRRALLLELLGLVVVDGQRERHLAGHHELRKQRMALAHRNAVLLHDIAKELNAL